MVKAILHQKKNDSAKETRMERWGMMDTKLIDHVYHNNHNRSTENIIKII